ncbi:hypothetical protein NMY22_g13521 [Coprinellus aureogranulatus]|nr:hypothetical protein NMY22_g13521 [Coprinellus aureogranulatus]
MRVSLILELFLVVVVDCDVHGVNAKLIGVWEDLTDASLSCAAFEPVPSRIYSLELRHAPPKTSIQKRMAFSVSFADQRAPVFLNMKQAMERRLFLLGSVSGSPPKRFASAVERVSSEATVIYPTGQFRASPSSSAASLKEAIVIRLEVRGMDIAERTLENGWRTIASVVCAH